MKYQLFISSGPLNVVMRQKTLSFDNLEGALDRLNEIHANDYEVNIKYTLVISDHGLSEKPVTYEVDYAEVRALCRASDIVKAQMFHDINRSRIARAALKNDCGVTAIEGALHC